MEFSKEQIAKTCHEVNRVYCESIKDYSQPKWEDAPDWQKESIMNGVEFHLNNDVSPEDSHNNWMHEKLKDGWVYGVEKNPEKKEHPCMMNYYDLSFSQRFKDILFKTIVDSLKNN